MAVHNGEKHIRQALDTLLAQDYKNFELIISDNASTDKTQEICGEYKSLDARIRYYRNYTNIGALYNFDRVFIVANGEYFFWVCHDDYWKPNYISSCLKEFSKSRDIILVGAECDSVDSKTGKLNFIDRGLSTVGFNPVKRFLCYKSTLHNGHHIGGIFYGLHKRNTLGKVMPMPKIVASDHIVMFALCFQGEFATVHERLMVKRTGGSSDTLKGISQSHGITNPLLVYGTYFTREFMLDKIIFQSDKLKPLEKAWLVCWSLVHTFIVVCVRLLTPGYQRLKRKLLWVIV
jgi:glycosyltransferase involved in cell wall biosynthesis